MDEQINPIPSGTLAKNDKEEANLMDIAVVLAIAVVQPQRCSFKGPQRSPYPCPPSSKVGILYHAAST